MALGTGTGASGSLSHPQSTGDVLGLIPCPRATLFSVGQTSLQGNMSDYQYQWHLLTPKLISGLPTTIQKMKMEAQNMC